MQRRTSRLLAAATLAIAAALPASAAVAAPAPRAGDPGGRTSLKPTAGPLTATIRRTAYGIPHIEATDYASLGFGYAYAQASDVLCVLADTYVTVDGERSRFFGPDSGYLIGGNGTQATNLDSDLYYARINTSGVVQRLVDAPLPLGLLPEVKELARGYTAGYNKRLADIGGSAGVTDPACKGAAWVRPVDEATVYRNFYRLSLLSSGGTAIDAIAAAQPPAAAAPGAAPRQRSQAAPTLDAAALGARLDAGAVGSNAIAVGRDATRGDSAGHGALLGNPHFPWIGSERFYQAQLTIPGELDATGGSLLGAPVVMIGYTADLAWSHTVSTSRRFALAQLTLDPKDPTSYLVDGASEPMTPTTQTVQARQSDGTLAAVTRTLYGTRYGPVLTSLSGQPLPWTATTAYALVDANGDNLRTIDHFLAMDRAHSVDDVQAILKRYAGVPWVNTIAADRAGNALYADVTPVPHLEDAELASGPCSTPLGRVVFPGARLGVFDGSQSTCAPGSDPDSVRPGLFGPSRLPQLRRTDYVANSNDSFWLSNPTAPLTGFPLLVGDTGTPRSLRTRIGLVMLTQRVVGTDGLGPAGVDRQDLQDILTSNRQYAGELTRDAFVGLCRSYGTAAPLSAGGTVDPTAACAALASWDRRETTTSRGAVLFRQIWQRARTATGGPWTVPFSAADPVGTPNTLDTQKVAVRTSIGDAVAALAAAGIPVDAPLGDVQYREIGPGAGEKVGVPGGPGDFGQYDAVYTLFQGARGYANPFTGSSYIQAVTWTGDTTCPDARTVLTYGETTDTSRADYGDQTRLFSAGQWARVPFCAADVRAQALSTVVVTDELPGAVVPEAPLALLVPVVGIGAGLLLLRRRRRLA